MAGYKMNQHRGGSTTFVSSRLGSARVGTQLKVENPVLLRTISDSGFIAGPRASLALENNTYLCPKLSFKISKIAISADHDTNIARKKSRTCITAKLQHRDAEPSALFETLQSKRLLQSRTRAPLIGSAATRPISDDQFCCDAQQRF
jgi:hypothetical protein